MVGMKLTRGFRLFVSLPCFASSTEALAHIGGAADDGAYFWMHSDVACVNELDVAPHSLYEFIAHAIISVWVDWEA